MSVSREKVWNVMTYYGVDARKEYSDWAAKVTPPDKMYITVHPPL